MVNSNCNGNNFFPIVFKVALAVLLGLLVPIQVAAWEIDPIQLELSSRQAAAAVTVRNDADEAVTIQIQTLSWTQQEGRDIYSATGDLIVSPGVVTLAAHAQQLVRVGLRRKADSEIELAYRVNFQEVAGQSTTDISAGKAALRIGLPVFITSVSDSAVLKSRWTALRSPDLKISVLNQSNRHIKVLDFTVYANLREQAIAGVSGVSYVLPGQMHQWRLKTKSSDLLNDGPLHLMAYTDAGVIETELLPDQP
jgi:fimbrial chaperone protein